MSRALRWCLLVSLVLHLLAVLVADRVLVRQDYEVFRARLAAAPRFTPPPRRLTAPPALPTATMEYRAPDRDATAVDEAPLATPEAPLQAAPVPEQIGEAVPSAATKGLQLAREAMPAATERPGADTLATAALDLVRIEDLMRADNQRAVVIPDPDSVRGTQGFIKLTPLYLDGMWSYLMPDSAEAGRPVLEDLAQYLRRHTGIRAEVRSTPARVFLSKALLKDPVHFLFPGPSIRPEPRLRLAPEERALLGRYLEEGGFLFIDAGTCDRRFLMAMVDLLRDILGADGHLFEVPAEHPLYHAFYDYPNGFPGEDKQPIHPMPFERPWYYPDRVCGERPPRGLWGVAKDERLVGVISDLDLHTSWVPPEQANQGVSDTEAGGQGGDGAAGAAAAAADGASPLPALRAGTNVLFYALLRPGGLTMKRALPPWRQEAHEEGPDWRPVGGRDEAAAGPAWFLCEAAGGTGEGAAGQGDDGVRPVSTASGGTPGQLAVVRSPVGRPLDGASLRVTLDGRLRVEVLKAYAHGALLLNLPAGTHRVVAVYDGQRQEAQIEVRAGRVTTLAFRLRGFGFLRSLGLEQMRQRPPVATWSRSFADLVLESARWEAR